MGYSAKVGSFNIDTSKSVGQTQAITDVGFEPKIVMFFWGGSTGTSDTVAGGTINIGFGAAISSTSRFCMMGISQDGLGSSDSGYSGRPDRVIQCNTAEATVDGILDFTSMDSGGFTLTVDDQFTNAYRISYLALGGTDLTNVYIGNQQVPGSTGNYSVTGVGFQPDAVICGAPSFGSDFTATHLIFSIGLATGASNQSIVSASTTDAQSTMKTCGYAYSGELTGRTISDLVQYRGSFVSFDSGGFTINHLEDTAVAYYYYICLKGGQYLAGDLDTRTDGNDISETVGFQPVALLFASANRAQSTQDTTTAHARFSIGAGTSTSNRACAAISDEDNLADSETAYANYDSAVYAHVIDDAIEALMDIKSIDSSGFICVMDNTETSACFVSYLAIGAAAMPTISKSEGVTLGEAKTVTMADALASSKSEGVTLGETKSVILPDALASSETDGVTIDDTAAVNMGDLGIKIDPSVDELWRSGVEVI